MDDEDFDLPPGDTLIDAIGALTRLMNHAKLRCLVAKRRWERLPSKTTEHGYLIAAQEYYYAAKMRKDFQEKAVESLATKHAEIMEKKGSVN